MNHVLKKYRHQFTDSGVFSLKPDESIKSVVSREGVSRGYGVYIISACKNGEQNIIYIGKAGTIQQDGSFKKQGIRKRLTMKQDGIFREQYFKDYISINKLDSLHFEWFVTFSNNVRVPPFLAEAHLLAAYFERFHDLPKLNKAI